MNWTTKEKIHRWIFNILCLIGIGVLTVHSFKENASAEAEKGAAKKVHAAEISYYRDAETGNCVGFTVVQVSCEEVKDRLVNPPPTLY